MKNLGKVLAVAVPALALAFLAFLAGAYAVISDFGPTRVLQDAHQAFQAWRARDKMMAEGDRFIGGLAEPERTDAQGVTVHDPELAEPGLTLYSAGHAQAAYLIDMEGEVVHEWSLPFSEVWDETAAVKEPLSPNRTFYRNTRALPDGSLLVIYEAVGDTPYGYGLAKLDREGNLVWKYLEHVHHDLDVLPDGRIVTLTQTIEEDELGSGPPLLEPPRIEDHLVILSPDGEVLVDLPLLDAVMDSPWSSYMYTLAFYIRGTGDVLHTNSVEYLTAEKAAAIPGASEGEILISVRELGALMTIDPESGEISWATKGYWLGQHDPDVLPNGNIMLFDNNGLYGATKGSRVIEFDPATLGLEWSYGGVEGEPLESVIRSSQEPLANGNVLIEESNAGRLVEVTRDKRIAWEYTVPVRGQGPWGEDDVRVPVVLLGGRYPRSYFEPGALPALSDLARR